MNIKLSQNSRYVLKFRRMLVTAGGVIRRMINLESIDWVKKRSKKSSKHEEMPCTNDS